MRWGIFKPILIVVAAWSLVALAWTPPTILVQSLGQSRVAFGALQIFASVLLSFVPWMMATPLILMLGRRYPLSEGRILAPLAIHVLAGLAIVPVATALGVILGRLAIEGPSAAVPVNLLSAVLITGFYSVPTYIAAVAVGQALAYFERYRFRERLLARAELRALKAQLNPHFLFNALNAISALGYRDAARADEALTRLSAILRLSLEERPELIPLKDEIAFAQDYLDLYALLLPGRPELAVEVEPETWTATVPAMLLQPLVENALLHGDGRLALSARRDGKYLSLRLVNGIPLALSPHGAGIGLENSRERLRVLFGLAAYLMFSREGDKAAVDILLPFHEVRE